MTRFSKLMGAVGLVAALSAGTAGATVITGSGYTGTDQIASNWIDISATGTNAGLSDDSYRRAAVGFNFSMYGSSASTLSIGSNGTVYFADDYLGLNNTPIPGSPAYTVQQDFIAVFWDDLFPIVNGADNVYYQTIGAAGARKFVVQWHNVALCCSVNGPRIDVEAVLFEGSNDILLQYLQTGGNMGAGATVGLQNTPTSGLQWSYNQSVLTDNLAICFSSGNTLCGMVQGEVPAPATLPLAGIGLAALAAATRRRRSA